MAAGEVLCKEGETGQEFFVIVEGETEVTSKGKRVAERGDGDFVGEIALLEETTRTATVTAKTRLRVFVLTRQGLSPPRPREPRGRAKGHASPCTPGRRAIGRPDNGVGPSFRIVAHWRCGTDPGRAVVPC